MIVTPNANADQLDPKVREVIDGFAFDKWAQQCHGASIHLVNDLAPYVQARVARGTCNEVFGQHSWVVLGDDCYDEDATIIDPTLWSYDESVPGIWIGSMRDGLHKPHGTGNIFQWGRPDPASGPVVEIEPEGGWSPLATTFLELLGPLDERGWYVLAHAPVEGWPAAEILSAIDDRFPGIVPIDIIGMLTDKNPGELYLATREEQDEDQEHG